jgi:hypothetical protein
LIGSILIASLVANFQTNVLRDPALPTLSPPRKSRRRLKLQACPPTRWRRSRPGMQMPRSRR